MGFMKPRRKTMNRLGVLVVILASSATAQLLVLNKEGNVAVIDPATQTILGKGPTGDGPHEVVSTTDGKFAVATNYGSAQAPGNTLSVIDLATYREVHRVDLAPQMRPHGLFAADGKVYFTCEGTKTVGRFDPATNRVDWVLGTGQDGTHMVALSKKGKLIFTSNIASGSVSIFEQTGNPGDWHQSVVKVGRGAEGFDISPNEKELWAANAGDGTVSIIDIAGRKVTETFSVDAKRSNRLKFTPEGKRVLISDLSTGNLVVIDAASRKEVKRLKVGSGIAGILVSRDGSKAYLGATPDNYVAVVDLKTLEMTSKISTGKGPDGMDWVSNR
jgi:YVTN family beta-propeller protein